MSLLIFREKIITITIFSLCYVWIFLLKPLKILNCSKVHVNWVTLNQRWKLDFGNCYIILCMLLTLQTTIRRIIFGESLTLIMSGTSNFFTCCHFILISFVLNFSGYGKAIFANKIIVFLRLYLTLFPSCGC